ncbi:phosphoribosylaminoimidazolesuccinocarboxamide synthase [Nonomuraea sp. M3C6]|uniref:Phosphoribosylaminoimidazole-succinocarboxamide synthase n=1 Tax=Nonomuraea marmarensis TaxID=3351344 RepID=A0ABW7ACA1_9ACTN
MTVEFLRSGSVRDLYIDQGDLILFASDRVAVHGITLPTPIPDKGRILTSLTLWWFERLADIIPNHIISTANLPAGFSGRAIRCRLLKMVPMEFIARGYLAGSGLEEYELTGRVSGIDLPPGLVRGSKLPAPIFTLARKGEPGERDVPCDFNALVNECGIETACEIRRITLEIYRRGATYLAERGIILADTKVEFGWTSDGGIMLGDEVLTSDSSRFWLRNNWQPGVIQFALDRQFVRDWLMKIGWSGRSSPPLLPADIVAEARNRYVMSFTYITGGKW